MADHGTRYELTHQEAALRSTVLSNVHYDLRMTLSKQESYGGILIVSLNASDQCKSIWLDFKGAKVSSVSINKTPVEVVHKDSRIYLPTLVQGENTVEIVFSNKYSRDGLGLHCYKDTEDNEIYLYTQFEPYSANRMFPCFDQPDVKATWDLVVKAPKSWKVISNENASTITENYEREMPVVEDYVDEEPTQVHAFPGKYRLSSYLYVLCAGGYVEHRNDNNEVNIPMGLYCRKSMNKYLIPERYFHWTVEGQKFYKEFFDFPYPFSKYDQVFVPEFNMGAMENVGCVTYRDQYIFKDPPSEIQLQRVCDTFLHEMAHMWFGDLVTMKWWDDLWLNESFATFMSSLAIDTQLKSQFPDSWRHFLASKGWGYATDQLTTTHPISTPVKTTTETETNFDGISYSKGSAVLKQLYFLVGPKVFQTAMGRYMKRFQFSNAEFADLIKFIGAAAFEDGSSLDINNWANSWILTAGLNELEPILTVNEGKLESLVVKQVPSLEAHPTLRSHAIKAEVFDKNMQSLKKATIQINPQSETVIDVFNGLEVAALILNVEDWGYCKIRIDDYSLQNLKDNLQNIDDTLTRQLVYRALWDMVRDTKLSGVEFSEFIIKHFPLEKHSGLASYTLEVASVALGSYVPSGPTKDALAHSFFSIILEKIKGDIPKEDSMIYQKNIKAFIYHPDDIKLAVSWVEANDTGIPNFIIYQLGRWDIIKKYATICPEAAALVQKELEKDPSDTGKLAKLYCESAYPVAEIKAKIWNDIFTEGEKFSRYERESILCGFNIGRQKELMNQYGQQFYDNVLKVITERDKEFYIDFCEYLIPDYMDEGWNIEKLEETIAKLPEDKFEISRNFKETVDMLKRIQRGKACSQKYIDSKVNQ